ncbi:MULTISPECIES: tRNA pseudouridine(55) synthase TruB [unclassified Ligilactobacillus]|uniref:tRNA pseudouridine(55) synthase TruB n=1 Tax=unclassified Ligilactobacillus TaxID=2767920 RepID=UPI003854AD79
MNGILPLYKERGMTSNDCVMRCRRLFHTRKVGHSGTLDPAVAGVLPICIGHATKVVNYLMASGKVYQGELILGKATETEDLEGSVIAQKPITTPFTPEELDHSMAQFCGTITQIPPMYSAVKVNGKRLYEYARAGEKVDRPARQIYVDYFKQLRSTTYDAAAQEQHVFFEVACGKGTYVRTLAVDLGRALGVPAVMARLTRIKSGGFTSEETVTLAQLEEMDAQQRQDTLVSVDHALRTLPHHQLTTSEWRRVQNGGFLPESQVTTGQPVPHVVLQTGLRVRAVYCYNEKQHRYQPERMIDLSE